MKAKIQPELEQLGLTLYHEFITQEEEDDIMKNIEKSEQKKERSRRNYIKRYGPGRPYKGAIVSDNIPSFLDDVAKKLLTKGVYNRFPDSVSINEYMPGQGIAFHVDSVESGERIFILSLFSDAIMKFRSLNRKTTYTINIPAKSLVVLADEIRDKWEHSIDPVQFRRYSIVFRRTNK